MCLNKNKYTLSQTSDYKKAKNILANPEIYFSLIKNYVYFHFTYCNCEFYQ